MAVDPGAPTRHPVAWRDPEFFDAPALDVEMRRVFDICHGCRRCFNLCDSFPRLFDLIDGSKSGELDSDFLVIGESDMKKHQGFKSTIKIDCEKCHNQEGVWWSLQTRSADEPETRFYRCVKCNHTWRDYT